MKKQRYLSAGRTTLELMGVLAILGSVAVGVYGMAANVISGRQTVDTLSKIHNLALTVQDAFSWTNSYVVTKDANTVYGTNYENIQAYLTGEGILKTRDLTLPTGDTVAIGSIAAVAASGTKAGTPSYFTLTITPDKYLCQSIAGEDWGNRLKSIKIGTTETAYASTPLALTTAVTQCTPSGSTNKTIVLTFM